MALDGKPGYGTLLSDARYQPHFCQKSGSVPENLGLFQGDALQVFISIKWKTLVTWNDNDYARHDTQHHSSFAPASAWLMGPLARLVPLGFVAVSCMVNWSILVSIWLGRNGKLHQMHKSWRQMQNATFSLITKLKTQNFQINVKGKITG